MTRPTETGADAGKPVGPEARMDAATGTGAATGTNPMMNPVARTNPAAKAGVMARAGAAARAAPAAAALAVLLLVGAPAGVPSPAGAVEPDEILADPALERRARNLSRQIRCLVCQSQSIDDSDAPLARDLRLLVRRRLEAGDNDGDVLAFLARRYGDYVLLRPPLKGGTALLWFGPLILLAAGAAVAAAFLLRRRKRND